MERLRGVVAQGVSLEDDWKSHATRTLTPGVVRVLPYEAVSAAAKKRR